MVSLALQEEAEVGDQEDAAEEGEEDPKNGESDQVDEQDGNPKENRDELPKPKDQHIDGGRHSVLC